MKKLLITCSFIGILLASCGDNESPRDLTFNLILEADGEPVVPFEAFNYPGGYELFLTKFSLFLSDITLNREDGSSVLLRDVIFTDLLQDVENTADATRGQNIRITNVPSDEYVSISMNVGVPPELNAQSPADFDPSSALSNNGEYWVGWSSYIFHKTEGKVDSDGDGEFETNVAIHIGSDDAFRTATYPINLDLSDDEEINLVLDVFDLYSNGNEYYNFIETPQIHHLGLLPKALPIMDALSTGFSIR